MRKRIEFDLNRSDCFENLLTTKLGSSNLFYLWVYFYYPYEGTDIFLDLLFYYSLSEAISAPNNV